MGIGRPISVAIEGCQCQSSAVAKTPLCEQLALGQGLLCCGEGQKHFCRGRKMKEVTDCVNFPHLLLSPKMKSSKMMMMTIYLFIYLFCHIILHSLMQKQKNKTDTLGPAELAEIPKS